MADRTALTLIAADLTLLTVLVLFVAVLLCRVAYGWFRLQRDLGRSVVRVVQGLGAGAGMAAWAVGMLGEPVRRKRPPAEAEEGSVDWLEPLVRLGVALVRVRRKKRVSPG